MNDFGTKVKQAREAAGMTSPNDLAFEINKITGERISRQTVINWESGSQPGAMLFSALCSVTGKTPDYFFGPKFVFKANKPKARSSKRAAA